MNLAFYESAVGKTLIIHPFCFEELNLLLKGDLKTWMWWIVKLTSSYVQYLFQTFERSLQCNLFLIADI